VYVHIYLFMGNVEDAVGPTWLYSETIIGVSVWTCSWTGMNDWKSGIYL